MDHMDHKAFENAMIEGVNRNAAGVEAALLAEMQERQQAEAAHNARMMRIRKRAAFKEILGTGILFLGIISAMLYLSHTGIGPGELPELVCTAAALGAGIRIGSLSRVFRKK